MADDPFKGLKVSPEAKEILSKIAAEVSAAYRENFDAMVRALTDLAEGQKRLQATVAVLVKALEPKLSEGLPAALSIALPNQAPDVAKAVISADPHAAGYTLTQSELSRELGLHPSDVSILVRAFRLDHDTFFSVRVRRGKSPVVLYRPEGVARFRELLTNPPLPLSDVANKALMRARRRTSVRAGQV